MNIDFILAGAAGVLFHSIAKAYNLQRDSEIANVPFRIGKDYLKKDFLSILMSFLSVGIWYLIFGEWASKYPALDGFALTSFVTMGGIGSYIIQLGMSRAKRKIRQVVDEKTNIADNKKTDI
jgi:hypothetical protein